MKSTGIRGVIGAAFCLLLDGVAVGDPRLLKDITLGSGNTFSPTQQGQSLAVGYLNGLTYFMTNACQLWQTDGTTTGTTLAYDFSAASTCAGIFGRVNNKLMLLHTPDKIFWVSDGTVGGTQAMPVSGLSLIRNLVPWQGNPGWSFIVTGGFEVNANYSVWITNGTAAGTIAIADLGGKNTPPSFAFLHRERAVIGGDNGLWVVNNPKMPAVQLGSGITHVGDGTSDMKTDGEVVYFKATDGAHGDELWFSDLTAPGTHIVKDFNVGPGNSTVSFGEFFNGNLYFSIGDILWRTDGTAANTVALTTPGQVVTGSIEAIADKIIFSGQENDGFHLWKSDGTPGGTVQYTDAPQSEDPLRVTVDAGSKLFLKSFSSSDFKTTSGAANDLVTVGQAPGQAGTSDAGPATFLYGQSLFGIVRRDNAPYSTLPASVAGSTSNDFAFGGAMFYLTAQTVTTGMELYAIDLPGSAAPICSSPNLAIPDNTGNSALDIIRIPQHVAMKNLTIDLKVAHTYIGDLSVSLTHIDVNNNVRSANLLARPIGCSSNDLDVIFDDLATLVPDDTNCSSDSDSQAYAAETRVKPPQALAGFVGDDMYGTWAISISDSENVDVGGITQWCLDTTGKSDVIFKNGYELPVQ
jgi:ELWxxDGT repeat protein